MKNNRVTQNEVAKLAGVSKTAVSLVLNNEPEIKIPCETRQRILSAARQLSYKLPIVPQQSRSGIIGMVMSRYIADFFTDPYYLKIYEAFSHELEKRSYLISFATVAEEKFDQNYTNPKVSEKGMWHLIPEIIYKERVDGVAIMGTISEQFTREICATKLKAVLVNFSSSREIDSVWFDNLKVTNKILNYLFSLGHRRIGLVMPKSKGVNFLLREKAFSSFLKNRNLSPSSNPVLKIDFNTEKSAYEKIKFSIPQIRKMGLTAILGADDLLSFGAIKALSEGGFKIPQDISVAGIDDIEEAGTFQIPLTTMQIPKEEMGKLAAKRLISRVENGEALSQKIFVSAQLIIRKSTGSVKKQAKGKEIEL